MTERCDVAIVATDPRTNARILLAQRGWASHVLERWPTPTEPRAVNFDHEVGPYSPGRRVSAEVRAISEPCATYEWRTRRGREAGEFR